MKDVVIVSACRTAIGSFGGTLRDTHATTIAKTTVHNRLGDKVNIKGRLATSKTEENKGFSVCLEFPI